MTEPLLDDLPGRVRLVLALAFLLGGAFGALFSRTHFCTMGAVSDVVNLGDWSRARMWALAAGVAIAGFHGLAAAGLIDPGATVHGTRAWLWGSGALGGLLFGTGMVLASGCGSRTLVRLGGGSLKALVVVLVTGLVGWMTIKGWLAVVRVGTIDRLAVELPFRQDLSSLVTHATGLAAPAAAALCAVVAGGGLAAWALSRVEGRHPEVLLGGLGTGLLVVAMWWLTGRVGFVAEHPETLEPTYLATASHRMEAFSFVAPMANALETLALYSDGSRTLSVGVAAMLGVVAGSALRAWRAGQFRWEGFRGRGDTARHLLGAALMGVGGVTAMGCSIGQGLTGLSVLGLTSLVTLPALVLGARLGLALLERWLEHEMDDDA